MDVIAAREAPGLGTSIDVGRLDEEEPRCARTPLDWVLIADLMEAASDLSTAVVEVLAVSGRPTVEPRGLSLPFPREGILDLMTDRFEREESLVSERLNDGYEAKPGSLALSPPPASPAFLSLDG